MTGLKDAYHGPHPPEITDKAKAWVVSIKCIMPIELRVSSSVEQCQFSQICLQ